MSNDIKYFKNNKGVECAEFKGNLYRKEKTGYYVINDNWNKKTKNSYRLHRAIMEDFLQRELAPNEVVHHKDGNKENNNIENLEVLENSKHSSLHSKNVDIVRSIKRKMHMDEIREKAIRWHKENPNSFEVHSKGSKKGWSKRPYYKHTCIQCNKEFYTRTKKAKYCSGQCKNNYNLGYSLVEIESIEYIGKQDVYNMEVEKYNNYAVEQGEILHNCDCVRYYCNTIMKRRILGRM